MTLKKPVAKSQKKAASQTKSGGKSTAKTKAQSKTKTKAAPQPFLSTGFWLMKSEPESYSIDQFRKDGKTLWTGVRNYQARNFMMHSMKKGDQVLFYHSNAEPSAVVGIGKITRTNLPDPTALDPKSEYHDPKASDDHPIWFCSELEYVGHLKKPLPLSELKEVKELSEMLLLKKGQRLSVQPVTKKEFDAILKLSGGIA